MPITTYHDPERPQKDRLVKVYGNLSAMGWTVTEAALEAGRQIRREAAQDVAFWSGLKSSIGRFAKDEQRRAQRTEKAATIWLRHFEEVGRKNLSTFPLEMVEELDAVFRTMNLAASRPEQPR